MGDFWPKHFNVFSGKAAVRWYRPSYERDVLRKNALGNFKDLVVGTAQHPAMLFFLDNFESVAPNSQQNAGRGNGGLQRALQNGTLNARLREQIKERQGLTDEQLDQRIKQMQQGGDVAEVHRRVLHAPVHQHLVDQPERAAVGVVRDDDVVTRLEQHPQQHVGGAHPGTEREGMPSALQRGPNSAGLSGRWVRSCIMLLP